MKITASAKDGYRAAVIGDLVGSRKAPDRRALQRRLSSALARSAGDRSAPDPLMITAGDEFQGSFATVGEALHASFLIWLDLIPDGDVRFGVGWGWVQVLDADTGTQDGPAWWQARSAIDTAEARAEHPGTRHTRFCYRAGPEGEGPSEPAVDAALLCRDQLIGSLGTRSLRILGGLMAGRSKSEIARTEGVSASAVSQRTQRDGLDVIIAASAMIREIA